MYSWNAVTSQWDRMSQDIDGEDSGDGSGYSVSLSGDGTTLAIGAPYNDGNNNNVTNPTGSIGSNADLLAFSGMAMNTSSSKTLLIDVPNPT